MRKRKPEGFIPSGSGLGGKKAKKPREDAEGGHSGSYLEVLSILSEGEIEGLPNGAKDLYLDGTPVQNDDGSFNFSGFQYEVRTGTPDQTRIPGYADDISSETTVGVEVKDQFPLTRLIINPNIDSIRLRVGVVLQRFPEAGGVRALDINFRISIREGSGPWVVRLNERIENRYSSLREFEYSFPVDNKGGTENRFSFRVERVTPQDTNESEYQRILKVQAFAETIERKLRYKNLAIVAARFDAEQFSSQPTFEAIPYGGLMQIPSNAVVNLADRGLDYSGIWDGTFIQSQHACTDPAWQLYDLLTNERFGLGKRIKRSQINRWDMYAISRHCMELVPDGNGGTERRFAANVLLEGKEDALRVIEAYRNIFRGFGFWIQGQMRFVADKPTPYSQIISQADLVDGDFTYSRTARQGRHSIFLVTFINPDEFYSTAVEPVEFPDLIEQFGVKLYEMSAFACHSRGQAYRAGRAAGLSEMLEYETVTFKMRARGSSFIPGQVIKVNNPKRANERYSGLIKSATTSAVTIDIPVSLSAQPHILSVTLQDGTTEERSITNGAGTATVLSLASPLPIAPNPHSTWLLTSLDLDAELFRVLNRIPVSGSMETIHEVVALRHEPLKQAAIENDLVLPTRQIRRVQASIPGPPTNVQISHSYSEGLFRLLASWQTPLSNGTPDARVTSYLVEYKDGSLGQWQGSQQVSQPAADFGGLSAGTYYVRVAAVDISNNASAWNEVGPLTLAKPPEGVLTGRANYTTTRNSSYAIDGL